MFWMKAKKAVLPIVMSMKKNTEQYPFLFEGWSEAVKMRIFVASLADLSLSLSLYVFSLFPVVKAVKDPKYCGYTYNWLTLSLSLLFFLLAQLLYIRNKEKVMLSKRENKEGGWWWCSNERLSGMSSLSIRENTRKRAGDREKIYMHTCS